MKKFFRVFKISAVRRRIVASLLFLGLYRLLAHIPVPSVDVGQIREFFAQNQVFGMLGLFTGGNFSNFSIVLLGVGPYITSSIIFQLLASVLPSLEELQKEGDQGQRKLTQYTRVATLPIALVQGYAYIAFLRSQGLIGPLGLSDLFAVLAIINAGSFLAMWIGELITEYGIGNGVSLLITLNILAGFPSPLGNVISLFQAGETSIVTSVLAFLIIGLIALVLVVIVSEARRNLEVVHARRLAGRPSYGQVRTVLPILVNTGGVIPIIFALAIISVPQIAATFFATSRFPAVAKSAGQIALWLNPSGSIYPIIYFLLVVAFTYFYAFVVVSPKKVAENLKRRSGFLPGVRPGRETESYLKGLLMRLSLSGSIFLGAIAILPFLMQAITGAQFLIVGGTGMLIVVAVVLETMRQLQAAITTDSY